MGLKRWVLSSLSRTSAERGRSVSEREPPYPVSAALHKAYSDVLPDGGGVECFDSPDARAINEARLNHLQSLRLPLIGKTVLDVGCGVGHLAQFFVREGCSVLSVDGRPENIERLRALYPALNARVFDVERGGLAQFGSFDAVFCYGLLYHLENPFRAVREMASVCKELLLLETCIVDHRLPVVLMKEETASYNQALQGVGCRPSPSAVVLALREAGFQHVYAPAQIPLHQDFQFVWRNDCSDTQDGHLLRAIFIASRAQLTNPSLTTILATA